MKICYNCKHCRNQQERQSVISDDDTKYPKVIEELRGYQSHLKFKGSEEEKYINSATKKHLKYYHEEPIKMPWCAHYTDKHKDECSFNPVTGTRQKRFHLCQKYNAKGDCQAFSPKTEKNTKKCDKCKHFCSSKPPTPSIAPTEEDFDLWMQIIESQHQRREHEAVAKIDMLKTKEQEWSFKPKYNSYCGLLAPNIYLAHELKNAYSDCKDFQEKD